MIEADPAAVIVVRGTPAPQGSKKAFRNQYTGRIQQVESSKNVAPWRDNVRQAAIGEILCGCRPDCRDLRSGFPLDEPLLLSVVFTVKKPVGAPKNRRTWPSGRPDLSKLLRSTEDALKDAGVFSDDARIVDFDRLAKCYPNEDPDAMGVPGVVIRIWRMHDVLNWRTSLTPMPGAVTLFDPVVLS